MIASSWIIIGILALAVIFLQWELRLWQMRRHIVALGEGRVVEVDVEVRDGGYTWVGTEYGPDIPDVLSDTLGNGHYTITRQPDKEPEKVRPWRLTFPDGAHALMCPLCHAVYGKIYSGENHDTERMVAADGCQRHGCHAKFGEPRDLSEVSDE